MAEPAVLAPDRPGPPGPATRSRRRPLAGLAVLLVVLGAALLIGSGAFDSHPASLAQRATSLETQIRCPSCEDVSVADSEASAAIAVRHQVTAEMRAGWSDQRIEAALVARYGPTILLRPPSSGLAALVWVLPAVAAAGALVWMGALFWRRSRQLAELRASGPDDLEDR